MQSCYKKKLVKRLQNLHHELSKCILKTKNDFCEPFVSLKLSEYRKSSLSDYLLLGYFYSIDYSSGVGLKSSKLTGRLRGSFRALVLPCIPD